MRTIFDIQNGDPLDEWVLVPETPWEYHCFNSVRIHKTGEPLDKLSHELWWEFQGFSDEAATAHAMGHWLIRRFRECVSRNNKLIERALEWQ
jgi:hypothetical protein